LIYKRLGKEKAAREVLLEGLKCIPGNREILDVMNSAPSPKISEYFEK